MTNGSTLTTEIADGVELLAPVAGRQNEILTPEALDFFAAWLVFDTAALPCAEY